MDETTTRIPEGESPKKKKSSKYWLSISVVLVMTALSLVFSLYNAGEGDIAKGGAYIYDALKGCNPIALRSMSPNFETALYSG